MTLRMGPIRMSIDARCTACGLCLITCPERALLPARRKPATVVDRCTACLACVEVCPVDAIAVEPISVEPISVGHVPPGS